RPRRHHLRRCAHTLAWLCVLIAGCISFPRARDEGGPQWIQLRAGLLQLEERDLAPRAFADLSAALVRSHPADWRVWVARTWAAGISGAEEEQAAAQAFRLAPDETQVLQAAAIRSLVHGKWEEAHALANRAWLRGSTT